MENLGRGWTEAVGSTLALPAGGRDRFRCGLRALPTPGSEEDNGSWALTSDRSTPPPRPIPSSPALGWQEELELYCHPGKNSN